MAVVLALVLALPLVRTTGGERAGVGDEPGCAPYPFFGSGPESPCRVVQQVTNVICFQEVSMGWAQIITSSLQDDRWRTHLHNQLFMMWRVDSMERIQVEWKMLFERDKSKYKN